jgi:hypothetical protein
MKHHTSEFETIAEWSDYGVPDPKLFIPKSKAMGTSLELKIEGKPSKCFKMRT